MTQSRHLLTDGSPEAQRGAETGEVTQRRGVLLCRPLPGPDSFINLAPPTAWDGGSIPSAQCRPGRGPLIKENSSVHKSLLLLSLPSAPPGIISGEREKEAGGHERWRSLMGGRKMPVWGGLESPEDSCKSPCQVRRCGPGQSLRVPLEPSHLQQPGFPPAGLCPAKL